MRRLQTHAHGLTGPHDVVAAALAAVLLVQPPPRARETAHLEVRPILRAALVAARTNLGYGARAGLGDVLVIADGGVLLLCRLGIELVLDVDGEIAVAAVGTLFIVNTS